MLGLGHRLWPSANPFDSGYCSRVLLVPAVGGAYHASMENLWKAVVAVVAVLLVLWLVAHFR